MDNSNERFIKLQIQNKITFSLFEKHPLGEEIGLSVGKKEACLKEYTCRLGEDKLGRFLRYDLHFELEEKSLKIDSAICMYDGFIVFEMVVPKAIKGKKNKHLFGHPYISFPSFQGTDWDEALSMLSYKRQAPFNYPMQWFGKVTGSLREGKHVPLLITNKEYETIVLSPMTELLFNSVSISHKPEKVRCGIPRGVKCIKKGICVKTLLVFGHGVNTTLERYGRILMTYYDQKPIQKNADCLLSHISYWTNAGSAYWYRSHKKQSYEETLKQLKSHHQKKGLNIGSYQLDSWWYRREGDNYSAGIIEWEPKAVVRAKNFNSVLPFLRRFRELDLFQDMTISSAQKLLNAPIGCHFKQLSKDSVYVKDHPDHFLIETFALPKDKEKAKELFIKIFTHPHWRLAYIIHDWLHLMNDTHSGFKDMEVADGYFWGLNEAVKAISCKDNLLGHVTVQLCMTQPHMILNSITMDGVTTIRATSDSDSFFVEGTKRWWWFAYSATFIHALGKYAFYDNRFSSKNYSHPLSAYSKFEFIWLGLSCGPIGIGDFIGSTNMKLIKRTVMEDGTIVKPDIKAKLMDACYLYNPNSRHATEGMGVFSSSEVGYYLAKDLNNERIRWQGKDQALISSYKITYLLLFNAHPLGRKVGLSFRLSEIERKEDGSYILFDYFSKDYRVITKEELIGIEMKRRKFYYFIIAPIYFGFAFAGDFSKHVSFSKQMFYQIKKEKKRLIIYCEGTGNTIPEYVLYSEKEIESISVNEQEIGLSRKKGYIRFCFDSCIKQGEPYEIIVELP